MKPENCLYLGIDGDFPEGDFADDDPKKRRRANLSLYSQRGEYPDKLGMEDF